MNKKPWLISIDLDGTLLKDSATGTIDPKDIEAIKRLTEAGHIVSLVTGRPWRAAKKAYESLGLKTVIANYNGAHIHNPSDYEFNHNNSYMSLNDIMYILGDKVLRKYVSNIAIEGPSWVMLEKKDPVLEKIFGFTHAKQFKLGFDVHRIPLRPTGVIFDTTKDVNVPKIRDYLNRKFGDLAEFSSWSKGEGLSPVFDMTAVGANKGRALSMMSRYYDIPLDRTIAIGDSYNDIPMFRIAELPIAMGNAEDGVKDKAVWTIPGTNKTNGIAKFVNEFLGPKANEFITKLRKVRREKYDAGHATVKAH